MIDATKLVARSAEAFTTQDVEETLEPITLQQAKEHLRVVISDEDDYILGLITAARQMAEGRLNRTLMLRTRRQVFDRDSTSYALRKPPVVSVDEVSVLDSAGAATVLDATAFRVRQYGEDAPLEIEALSGATWPGLLRTGSLLAVDYLAGYPVAEVPAPIITWMKLAIGTMYQNRETLVNGTISQPLAGNFWDAMLQPYMVYE